MSLTLLLKIGFIAAAILVWQLQPYMGAYFMLGAVGIQFYEFTYDGESTTKERLKLTLGILGFFTMVGICALVLGF